MTTMDMVEELDTLIRFLERSTSVNAHIGISLQAMALTREYEVGKDSSMESKMYDHPFFSYFQQTSTDMHSQYPLRKMALLEALQAYKRYLAPKRAMDT